jgi:hypothetical protein
MYVNNARDKRYTPKCTLKSYEENTKVVDDFYRNNRIFSVNVINSNKEEKNANEIRKFVRNLSAKNQKEIRKSE